MSVNDDASEENQEEVLIRILGLDDKESLNSLAKLIGQDTGRQLLDILVNSEKGMYKGELTKKMPVTYSVTSYHLSNAEKLGLVEKSERVIHKKGIKHTHNKIPKQILILPLGFDKEELKKIKTWKKLIRNGIKFTSLVFGGVSTWSISNLIVNWKTSTSSSAVTSNIDHSVWLPIIITMVVIVSLTTFVIKKEKK